MQSNCFKVAILGGGPAGMFCALQLRHSCDYDVHLLDRNPNLGRKMRVTGSGRCNLTNMNMGVQHFYSNAAADLELDLTSFLERFSPARMRGLLLSEGVPTANTEDGWVYPKSFSAANTVEILRGNLIEAGVHIHESIKVDTLTRSGEIFELRTAGGNLMDPLFDSVVIASGSRAYPQLNADCEILASIEKMGIYIEPFRPALSPILTQDQAVKALRGVRLDAAVTLFQNGKKISQTFGNVIFTEKGINGPGVMNLSHLVTNEKTIRYDLSFDFLTDADQEEIEARYFQERQRNLPYRSLFLAHLPDKLVECFLKTCKVDNDAFLPDIAVKDFYRHLSWLRNFAVPVKANDSFRVAQVCSGGVKLQEISFQTMEAKKIPGLFFAGEVLDIIGHCGGYNLHWAIASGYAAANGVISRLNRVNAHL